MKKILFSMLLLISCLSANSQYFNTGQDPASISWKQINTDRFQIIFPAETEVKARYIAALFEDLIQKGGKDLKHTPKKFSVVLHSRSATTNGMVAWAPKRMELFTTSGQDNDAQLWLNHVSTHEYRHVIQLDKIKQGFTRFLNYIFGQQATAVVVGLYIPPWFLEGDAVCLETALGKSGRGRNPEFKQELRAQLLEKGIFSYDKAVNGSYQDFITDRYKLGYYLVGKARATYGNNLWDNALNKVAQKPYGITSFADGIKSAMHQERDNHFKNLSAIQDRSAINLSVEKIDWEEVKNKNDYSDGKLLLYYDSMKELLWEWQVEDAKTSKSEFVKLSDREKFFTNKRVLQQIEDGRLIYLKQGLADKLQFELLQQDGTEKELFTPGYMSHIDFDYQQGKLIWSEKKENLRWEKGDRSILVSYDINKKKRRTYKHKHSLFAPSFNKKASKIVAVETDNKGDNKLIILDAISGKVLNQFSASKQEYFMSPRWENENSIIMILLNKNGKHLVRIDVDTNNQEILFSSGSHDMSRPTPGERYIYFNGAFSGIDNLFAFDKETDKIYQVTSSRFGAKDALIDADIQLYYSDYTSDGYLPVRTKTDPKKWVEWKGEYFTYPLAEDLSEQLGEKIEPDTANLDRFPVKNYSKLTHLFNFHSWAPAFVDGLDGKADVGISFASQNQLSTLMTTVGYKKEEGYDNGQFYANLSYRGWFPIIDSKLTVGDRDSEYATIAERIFPKQQDTILVNTTWRQWEWENSISLPFNISSGQYTRKIIPKVTYNIAKLADLNTIALATTQTNPLGLGKYNFADESISQEIMEYQLFAYNIARTAPRDIQYQWAQILEFNYRNTPFGDSELGETYSLEGDLYFPGFIKHHGLKLYAGYQYRSLNNSLFSNMIKSPRGMSDLYGKHVMSSSIDYALPLFYPDWNLGPLTYFKRIKLNAFADFGHQDLRSVTDAGVFKFKDNYTSGGIELTSDLHVLRFSAPVNVGVRLGYENKTNAMFADFLISFSLTGY